MKNSSSQISQGIQVIQMLDGRTVLVYHENDTAEFDLSQPDQSVSQRLHLFSNMECLLSGIITCISLLAKMLFKTLNKTVF